ncbi:MAG: hypothetical protein HYZ44_16920 [Bacteroidetes bacterium]|nr:hypothetical protein [Bacteroidota bacterium]
MRTALPIVTILLIALWGYKVSEQDLSKLELRKSTNVIEAKIIELDCYGKRKVIKFQAGEGTFIESIYISLEECFELSKQDTIGVKIDSEGHVIFSNDDYNDSTENEILATILICLFLISMIFYYGILPEIRELLNRENSN